MSLTAERGAKLTLTAIILTVVLTACGGGGGTSPSRTDTGVTGSGGSVSVGGGGTSQTPPAPQPHLLSVQASPSGGGTIVSNPQGINCGADCSTSFVSGTAVALTVAPAQGMAFAGWGGACSGTGACSVTLDSDKSVIANFATPPASQVTLSVSSMGDGAGTITSNPAGIDCGATCASAVAQGTSVTLTATPDSSSAFAGWNSAVCTGTGACTVTVNANTAIVANFVPLNQVGVGFTGSTGTGSITSFPSGIDCSTGAPTGSGCSATFVSGTTLSLAAKPGPGSVFDGWSGACSGTGSCTVALGSNSAITSGAAGSPSAGGAKKTVINGKFSTISYTLGVTNSGTGTGTVTSNPAGISCGTTCSFAFTSGTSVTLTATPATSDSVFTGWSGGACTGTGTCTVSLSANTSVTATFSQVVTVNVNLALSGTSSSTGGTVTSSPAGLTCSGSTCTGTFPSGTSISFAASPNPGYVFTGWTGACSGTSDCVVTLSSRLITTSGAAGSPSATSTTLTLGANFAPATPQFALAVSKTNASGGTVTSTSSPTQASQINCGATCTVNYNSATVVTLNPTAAAGFVFNGWSSCPGAVTGTACAVTMDADKSATADFIPTSFPVTVSGTGTGNGSVSGTVSCTVTAGVTSPSPCTSAPINTGNTVTLNATAAAGSVFAGWSGACSGTGSCSFPMGSSPASVTASFTLAPQITVTVAVSGPGTVTSSSTPTQATQINCTSGSAIGCTATFPQGATVTMSPAPGANAVFTSWGDACSGSGACSFAVGATPISVSANFTQQYSVTVSKSGSGTVTSSSSPTQVNQISCGATCSVLFSSGTSVSLTPAASPGSAFTGWSNDCTGTAVPCTVTIDAAKAVTATFTAIPLTVTGSGTGKGSVSGSAISCNYTSPGPASGTCTNNGLSAGNTITLNAAADTATSTFTGWSGACTGTGSCIVTQGSTPVTVNANFDLLPTVALTMSNSGAGPGTGTVTSTPAGISCTYPALSGTCSFSFPQGTSVALNVSNVPAGSAFFGWSGACTGSNACTVSVNTPQSVTAVFNLTTLTVTGSGAGTGSVSGSGISCNYASPGPATGTCTNTTLNKGDTVNLSASADPTTSVFSGWSGACSGTGSCSYTVGSSTATVNANFDLQQFALTVLRAGTGAASGTVTSTSVPNSAQQINCGVTCGANYGSGTLVTLSASAPAGFAFAGWSGACTGTSTSCQVTMNSAQTVTATFNKTNVVVTGAGSGTGTVTNTVNGAAGNLGCTWTGSTSTLSGTCDSGTTISNGNAVVLTATAAGGSTFVAWSGCPGTVSGNTSVSTCTFAMPSSGVTVGVNFANTTDVTVMFPGNGNGTITGTGGISCTSTAGVASGTCTVTLVSGTSATLSVNTPLPSGTVFTGWSGPCSGTGNCTFTVPASAVSVFANLTQQYNLTVTKSGTAPGSGSIAISPAGTSCGANCTTYNSGTSVSLTPSATAGNAFAGWSNACTGTTVPCAVTMDAAKTVDAAFNSITLTVTGSGTGKGSVSGSGITCNYTSPGPASGTCTNTSLSAGNIVTLTAAADTATSTFKGWTGACTGTGSCTFTQGSSPVSVNAQFDLLPTVALTMSNTGAGTGTGTVTSTPPGISCTYPALSGTCNFSFPQGTAVALNQSSVPGSAFSNWSGACTGTSCSVTLDTAKSVTAVFNPTTLTVSGSGAGKGSVGGSGITCNYTSPGPATGTCTNTTLNKGDTVTLTAAADPATSSFAGWSGPCSGTGFCTYTVGASPTAVTASFALLPTFTLTVTASGPSADSVTSTPAGILNCSSSGGAGCSASFVQGTSVTLNLNALAAGTAFAGWGGACSSNGACSVTMNSNQAVSAAFVSTTVTVNLAGSTGNGSVTDTVNSVAGDINCQIASGTISGTCTNTAAISSGNTVKLTATAVSPGSVFSGWSGCPGTVSTNTCTFPMPSSAVTVGATFSPAPQFALSVTKSGTGAGSGTVTSTSNIAPPGGSQINCGATCSVNYITGTVVSLTPSAPAGTSFINWGGACSNVIPPPIPCNVTVDAAKSVSANFTATTVTVAGAGTGSGSVTGTGGISCAVTSGVASGTCTNTSAISNGTPVSLSATAKDAFSVFAGWTLSPAVTVSSCVSASTCTFTMQTSAETVTANFAPTPQFTLTLTKLGGGVGTVTSTSSPTQASQLNCGTACTSQQVSYLSGAAVTLTASAPSGSTFTGWSGGVCTGTGPCVVNLNANTSVTANFATQFNVSATVSLSGGATGKVTSTSNPTQASQISCTSGTCTVPFTSGTVVSLAAAPGTGYVFNGWGGACSGTGSCSFTVTTNTAVTASFGLPQATLTVSNTGSGTVTSTSSPTQAGQINCGSTCSATYNQGTSVTLTATPAAGAVFSGWGGSACAGTAPCTLTLNSNTSVSATFSAQYGLAVSKSVSGSYNGTVASGDSPQTINCGSTCSASYGSGTIVSLAASPASGSNFNGWSGACSGTNACSVTMSSSQSVTATFGAPPPPQYTVTVTNSGTGTGTVTSSPSGINCGSTCSATFGQGTTILLTATADTGSAFAGWSASVCSGIGSCNFTVSGPQSLTANFVPVQALTVLLSSSSSAVGTVTSNPPGINCPGDCVANFNVGTSVTLTATPGSGAAFNGWSGACSGTSLCVLTIGGAATVTADFEVSKTTAAPFLTASPSPFSFGSVQTGTTSTQKVQISNTGPSTGGNLVISGATVDNPLFAVPSTQFPLTVAPGSSVPMAMSFSPQVNGTVTGNVSFASNASNPTATLSLSGNGSSTTSSGLLTITPTTLYFGGVTVGTTQKLSLTMANPGTGTTIVSAGTVSGSGFAIVSPTFPLSLGPGAIQIVTISFTPQSTDSVTGVVTFTSDAAGSPVLSLVASGSGTSPTTAGTASPNNISFGTVVLGFSGYQTVTVYNTGNTSLTLNSISVLGSGFSAPITGLPLTIPINSSQVITLVFTPQVSGTSTGTVTFNTNATGSQPTVFVSGTGGFASNHRATLSWTASTTTTVVGYNIYRSSPTAGTFRKLNSSLVTATSFIDATLVAGQTYYWVVTAVDGSGLESSFSKPVGATIPSP